MELKKTNPDADAEIEQAWRELAHREGNGLEVSLLWYKAKDTISVDVFDSQTEEHFELIVSPDHALDAFNHPFAYRETGKLAVSEAFSQAA